MTDPKYVLCDECGMPIDASLLIDKTCENCLGSIPHSCWDSRIEYEAPDVEGRHFKCSRCGRLSSYGRGHYKDLVKARDLEPDLQLVGSLPVVDLLLHYRNEEKGLTIVMDWPRSWFRRALLRLLGIQVTWDKKEK